MQPLTPPEQYPRISGALDLSGLAIQSDSAALLRAIAQIAGALATRDETSATLASVCERIALTVDAGAVSIWLGKDGELRCEANSGPSAPPVALVRRAMSSAAIAREENITVIRLDAGRHPLGALLLAPSRSLSVEDRTFLAVVADILAPVLRQSAYAHRLENEVLARTRQIDQERRATENIIDSLPVGLYVIDRDYRITVWNRKRETGTQGVSREEAVGQPIFEILHRQPADVLRREFDEVFATGKLQVFQMESSVTGEVRTYRISKIPMRLGAGPVTHVITIGEDVTEWRAAQERFSQTEKLAAVGTLAAGVMHEINNPLATISACAESLEMTHEDANPEIIDGFKLIQSEVMRCKRIVDSLLDFSRPRAEEKAVISMNDTIERTLFVLRHHPRFKKLTVQTELDPTLDSSVRANLEQLMQVFMSLLINAMDAMHDRGTITLRTFAAGDDQIVAEIIDEGEGIRGADLKKIFEPFFTTKAPGRGTGLGLSICYAIVAEHGGRIVVDSTPGKGSAFRIVLPRARAYESVQ